MRWGEHNVNPMLVLRNAVCNRRWHETWRVVQAKQGVEHRSQRQTESQQRLTQAAWTRASGSVRLARLSQPTACPSVPAPAPQPVRRLSTAYSWRQPFLRRPASTSARTPETGAKK